jgi:hypothetical protein
MLTNHDPILGPVIALVLWTCFMQAWMALTRIPYMAKNRIHPAEGGTHGRSR